MSPNELLLVSILSLLNTAIEGAKTFESGHNESMNSLPSTMTIPEENKRIIYHDIKNHLNHNTRNVIPKLPRPFPSILLKPPNIQKHDLYSIHKKIMNDNLMKSHFMKTIPSAQNKKKKYISSSSFYIRDHTPDEQLESSEKPKDGKEEAKTADSKENGRINFHIHGHRGPDTYVFGYDTGNGQFRYEERHHNGTVTGHYGYYDSRGRLRKINYTSHPLAGYKSFPFAHK
ncbi:uncharacterized protein [Fopius arisanus]|uniref:Uncharacterized protein isoform X2 n=1 Tax=Fopius arisanus TaxID=64838 RepID=A0A9R1TL55_9HYME|nr:PREDICTED: uncharacterized protein LOC105271566 isoform X2 [Fopius arisanus]